MTDAQKNKIAELRIQGCGYKKIAALTGISENTVKSYCRRNDVAVPDEKPAEHRCLNCGALVEQKAGRKVKKFCSDKCRNRWWNAHPGKVKRKMVYEFVCSCCGKPFSAYGNKDRKYCCRDCYIEDRFGGGRS